MKRWGVFFALLIAVQSTVHAQGMQVTLYFADCDLGVHTLTDACDGGNPLPNGVTVEIFWDDNSNGPDDTDELYPADCPDARCANFNTFPINGDLFCPGAFYTETDFTVQALLPSPPRFWLRICVPGENRYWRSEVWTAAGGLEFKEFHYAATPADSATVENAMWCVNMNCICNVPDSPSGIVASQYECDLQIQWNDVTDEDGYVLYRDGIFSDSVTANVVSWTDPTASGDITYSYSVSSFNVCGTWGPVSTATGIRTTAPSAPSNVAASNDRCDAIHVSWNDVTQEEGYIVRRNGGAVGFLDANETEFDDLIGPGCYTYRIQAYNGCGASQQSSPVTGCRYAIPSVLSFLQSSQNCDSVHLQFQASANSDSVAVYRDGFLIARLPRTESLYTDHIGIAGDYSYNVVAENLCGNSSSSDTLIATIKEYPSGPSSLQAVEDSCSSITISWLAATGDFGGYDVFRDGSMIASLPNTELAYLDQGLKGGAEYSYWVTAVNDTCGSSEPSESLSASITVASDPDSSFTVITMQGASAILCWSPVDSTVEGCPVTVTHYLVFYSPTEGGPYYYHGLTSDTSYVHTGVIAYAPAMFYNVTPMTGAIPGLLRDVEPGEMTREDVMEKIENRKLQIEN